MGNKYEYTKRFRKERKIAMADAFGGKCCVCGYKKCKEALEFHHLNPSEKEFSISQSIRNIKDSIKEAKKCILVCSNCHKEIHYGITVVNESMKFFNEEIIKEYIYRHKFTNEESVCSVCGNIFSKKNKRQKYCSYECSCIGRQKNDRPTKEELKRLVEETNLNVIRKRYNVSYPAVVKWCKKYRISYKKEGIEKQQHKKEPITIVYKGKTMTIREWSRELNIPVTTIRNRMRVCDSVERILRIKI